MASIEELQARLASAEDALHRLLIGALEASVGSGDTQVAFSRTTVPELRNYIADLKSQIAVAQGQTRSGSRRLEVYF